MWLKEEQQREIIEDFMKKTIVSPNFPLDFMDTCN